MTDLRTQLVHLVLLLAAIGAVCFLAANGDITGSAAVEVISFAIGATATAGGVTAGAKAATGGAPAPTPSPPAADATPDGVAA